MELTEIQKDVMIEALDILLSHYYDMTQDVNIPIDRELERKSEAAEEMYLEITGAHWSK